MSVPATTVKPLLKATLASAKADRKEKLDTADSITRLAKELNQADVRTGPTLTTKEVDEIVNSPNPLPDQVLILSPGVLLQIINYAASLEGTDDSLKTKVDALIIRATAVMGKLATPTNGETIVEKECRRYLQSILNEASIKDLISVCDDLPNIVFGLISASRADRIERETKALAERARISKSGAKVATSASAGSASEVAADATAVAATTGTAVSPETGRLEEMVRAHETLLAKIHAGAAEYARLSSAAKSGAAPSVPASAASLRSPTLSPLVSSAPAPTALTASMSDAKADSEELALHDFSLAPPASTAAKKPSPAAAASATAATASVTAAHSTMGGDDDAADLAAIAPASAAGDVDIDALLLSLAPSASAAAKKPSPAAVASATTASASGITFSTMGGDGDGDDADLDLDADRFARFGDGADDDAFAAFIPRPPSTSGSRGVDSKHRGEHAAAAAASKASRRTPASARKRVDLGRPSEADRDDLDPFLPSIGSFAARFSPAPSAATSTPSRAALPIPSFMDHTPRPDRSSGGAAKPSETATATAAPSATAAAAAAGSDHDLAGGPKPSGIAFDLKEEAEVNRVLYDRLMADPENAKDVIFRFLEQSAAESISAQVTAGTMKPALSKAEYVLPFYMHSFGKELINGDGLDKSQNTLRAVALELSDRTPEGAEEFVNDLIIEGFKNKKKGGKLGADEKGLAEDEALGEEAKRNEERLAITKAAAAAAVVEIRKVKKGKADDEAERRRIEAALAVARAVTAKLRAEGAAAKKAANDALEAIRHEKLRASQEREAIEAQKAQAEQNARNAAAATAAAAAATASASAAANAAALAPQAPNVNSAEMHLRKTHGFE